jgi:type VI protein secretion system component Hcp
MSDSINLYASDIMMANRYLSFHCYKIHDETTNEFFDVMLEDCLLVDAMNEFNKYKSKYPKNSIHLLKFDVTANFIQMAS